MFFLPMHRCCLLWKQRLSCEATALSGHVVATRAPAARDTTSCCLILQPTIADATLLSPGPSWLHKLPLTLQILPRKAAATLPQLQHLRACSRLKSCSQVNPLTLSHWLFERLSRIGPHPCLSLPLICHLLLLTLPLSLPLSPPLSIGLQVLYHARA